MYVGKTNYIIFHMKGKHIDIGNKRIVFNNNEIGKTNNDNLIHNHPDPNMRAYKSLGIYLDETLL